MIDIEAPPPSYSATATTTTTAVVVVVEQVGESSSPSYSATTTTTTTTTTGVSQFGELPPNYWEAIAAVPVVGDIIPTRFVREERRAEKQKKTKTFTTSLITIVSIFCIVWGSLYIHDDCERMLAIWLVVYGSTTLVSSLLSAHAIRVGKKEISNKETVLGSLVSVFNFCWWIVGAAWAYNMKVHGFTSCPEPLFLAVFWIVTTGFIALALVVALAFFSILAAAVLTVCVAVRAAGR